MTSHKTRNRMHATFRIAGTGLSFSSKARLKGEHISGLLLQFEREAGLGNGRYTVFDCPSESRPQSFARFSRVTSPGEAHGCNHIPIVRHANHGSPHPSSGRGRCRVSLYSPAVHISGTASVHPSSFQSMTFDVFPYPESQHLVRVHKFPNFLLLASGKAARCVLTCRLADGVRQ
jgi:hypothetical protein